MKILVTGIAGFIGYHVALKLAEDGHNVYGIDNINDYYDVQLKYDRLNDLGINQEVTSLDLKECHSNKFENLRFKKVDLTNDIEINNLFGLEMFDKVCHLAAQAGVRYSIENPKAYINSNILGFLNILECCKNHDVKHLVYASSSSVYGNNKKTPFGEQDVADSPISLYASTKKSNELMAYTYNHLYGLTTTGLRFFTVYGPWGRPDMAIHLFTNAILTNTPLNVFNNGKLERDFTYIDDIVEGVHRILVKQKPNNNKLYNIGCGRPINIFKLLSIIEEETGLKAIKNLLPIQPGDMVSTFADINQIKRDYQYFPTFKIEDGIKKYVKWFREYYN